MFRNLLLALFLSLIAFNGQAKPTPADAQYISNGNFLNNPSFEEGRGGWTIANGTVTTETADKSHLSRALSITLAAQDLSLSQNFDIPNGMQGQRVYFSVFVKSPVIIEVCSVIDAVTDNCISSTLLNAWENVKGIIPALGAANGVIIRATGVTGAVLVDNFIVSPAGASGGGGTGALPPGGDIGAVVVKQSLDDYDVDWDTMAFDGYSSRFNELFSSTNLRDTLEKILEFSYLAPQVTLSGSSNILREKGDSVSSVTLSASVTRRSDPIARIQFFQGVTSIADYNPPVITGSGITTAPYSTPFSDNISFTVQVTDTGATGGPTTVTSNTLTYNFVYPYYYGAGAPGLTAASVAGLTKNIIASTATVNRSFTTGAGDVYYFAYPASYGVLASILDENGFEVIGDWTLRVENITGLDSTPVSYNIYEFNNPVVAGSTDFTFSR